MTRPSDLLALKVGSPAVTVCSLKNPFGVVHLEVTAVDIAINAVTVRIRIQHAPLGTTADIPEPLRGAWSPSSALIRAPYTQPTDVQVIDQNGKAWKLVLHPEHLRAARS